MDFLSSQTLMYTSEKYENIYTEIGKNTKISYPELFTLACSIGFKKGKRTAVGKTGREFRSNYLSSDEQKTIIYTILLEDKDLRIDIEDLMNKERFAEYKKVLQEYAEGGMDILLKEALPPNIHIETNAKSYKNYIVDIMSYVYKESQELPF